MPLPFAAAGGLKATLGLLGKLASAGSVGLYGVDAYEAASGNKVLPQSFRDWQDENPVRGHLLPAFGAFGAPYMAARGGRSLANMFGISQKNPIVQSSKRAYAQSLSPNFKDAAAGVWKLEAPIIGLRSVGDAQDENGEFSFANLAQNLAFESALSAGVGGAISAPLNKTFRKMRTTKLDERRAGLFHADPTANERIKQKEGKKLGRGDFAPLFSSIGDKDAPRLEATIKDKKKLIQQTHSLPAVAILTSKMRGAGKVSDQQAEFFAQQMLPKDPEARDEALSHVWYPRIFQIDEKMNGIEAVTRRYQDRPEFRGKVFSDSHGIYALRPDGMWEVTQHIGKHPTAVDGKRMYGTLITDAPSKLNPRMSALQEKMDLPDATDDQIYQFLLPKNADEIPTLMVGARGMQNPKTSVAPEKVSKMYEGEGLKQALFNQFAPLAQQGSLGDEAQIILQQLLPNMIRHVEGNTNRFLHGLRDAPTGAGGFMRAGLQDFSFDNSGVSGFVHSIPDDEWKIIQEQYLDDITDIHDTSVIDALPISDQSKSVLNRIHEEFTKLNLEGKATASTTGNNWYSDHFMLKGLRRQFEGKNFLPLYDVDGNLKRVVGGKSYNDAMKNARALAPQLKLTVGKNEVYPNSLDFLQENYDVDGFVKTPLSKSDYISQLKANHETLGKRIAAMGATWLSEPMIRTMKIQGRNADMLEKRLEQFQNKNISLLAPADNMLYKAGDMMNISPQQIRDFGSKVNQLMAKWTFGFADAAMATMTMLTMMHNGVPMTRAMLNNPRSFMNFFSTMTENNRIASLKPSPNTSVTALMGKGLSDLVNAKNDPAAWADLKRAMNDETVNHQAVENFYQAAERNLPELKRLMDDKNVGMGRKLWSMMHYAGGTFAITSPEMFSRMHGFMMARRLMKQLGAEGDELYQMAREFTDRVFYRYKEIDRPAIFSGAVGSSAGLFKTWVTNTAFMTGALLGKGYTQKAYTPALTWLAANTMIGGALGNPILGTANNIASYFSDTAWLEDMTYEKANDWDLNNALPDGLLYGLPAAMGQSLASRTALPGAEVARDVQMLTSFIVYDRLKMIAQGAGATMEHYQANTDTSVWDNPQAARQIYRGILPKTFYRGMEMIKNDDMVSARTGYPVKEGLTMGEKIGYMLGFSPTEIEIHQRVASRLWEDKQKKQEITGVFGQELMNAEGNPQQQEQILRTAIMQGIPLESIDRSYKQRVQESQKDIVERAIVDEQRERFKFFLERYSNQ